MGDFAESLWRVSRVEREIIEADERPLVGTCFFKKSAIAIFESIFPEVEFNLWVRHVEKVYVVQKLLLGVLTMA